MLFIQAADMYVRILNIFLRFFKDLVKLRRLY